MKRALRNDRGRRAGFTLVEVVLAMFVLLLGMTSILGLLSFGAALARSRRVGPAGREHQRGAKPERSALRLSAA